MKRKEVFFVENKTNKLFTNPWFVALAALLCCALWGSASPAIKIGYELIKLRSGDVPSTILFAGLRFALAGILTIIIYSIARRKVLVPQKKNWGKVMYISLIPNYYTISLFLYRSCKYRKRQGGGHKRL